MNYIWEPLIQMMQRESAPERLCYRVQDSRVSPYLELQPDSLYEEDFSEGAFSHIDVNPYLRFESLFEAFVTPDDLGYGEFNEAFADVILHELADLDFKSGRSKREYYLRFILSDLADGIFGGLEDYRRFSIPETRVLAEEVLTLYQTCDYFACIMDAVGKLFPFCQVFLRDSDEIVFYMREEKEENSFGRIRFLIRLFLPVTVPYVVHWNKTYGVAGYDATMGLEDFIL